MEMRVRFAPHLKLRLGEWLSSAILASMGLVLLLWPNIIAARIFPLLREWGGTYAAQVWTTVFLSFGLTHGVALWINGRRPVTPFIRMVISFLSCFVWWQLNVAFFLSGVPAIIWGIMPWLLALEMYNVFQASADAREVFDARRTVQNGLGKA